MISGKCFPYRPHDYVYDPLFTVSGPTDHYKAAIIAKVSTAKFQICPIFPNMFSDLPNHPRRQLVQRRVPPPPRYIDMLEHAKKKKKDPALSRPVDVRGSDRFKFFAPIVNVPPPQQIVIDKPCGNMPVFTIKRVKKPQLNNEVRTSEILQDKTKSKNTETMFRESEAQTAPWEPDYKVIGEGEPEVMKLEFLKWGSGLPAGVEEVRLIERARMKLSWEKYITKLMNNTRDIGKVRDYIDAIERDEWAFREKEIEDIQDLRMELLERMLGELLETSKNRNVAKMTNFIVKKQKEKDKKIAKIKLKTERELRKLRLRHQGYDPKYKEYNIIKEYMDPKSELHAPLMRNGEHPKRWHFVIDEQLKKYRTQFAGVEEFNTLPRRLDAALHINPASLKTKDQLCYRETKWSEPVLKMLHSELSALRNKQTKKPCNLLTKIKQVVKLSTTPQIEDYPDKLEEIFQMHVYLQSIIKGRASQLIIYEGRDRCRELINELKCSQGLLNDEKRKYLADKANVKERQRTEGRQIIMVNRLQSILSIIRGSIVGTLLDFLNKELRRLLEERKAHAMCALYDRERYAREADEAGRRQQEIRRRKEHDEMFKQIVKVNQETVDLYLRDIITEGISFASESEAKDYVVKMAEKIDKETHEHYMAQEQNHFEDEEYIADLVHHFLLPDVEKTLARDKLKTKQKFDLKQVHEAVYSKLESIEMKSPKPKAVEEREAATKYVQEIMTDMLDEIQQKASIKNEVRRLLNEIVDRVGKKKLHHKDVEQMEKRKLRFHAMRDETSMVSSLMDENESLDVKWDDEESLGADDDEEQVLSSVANLGSPFHLPEDL